MRSGRLIAAGVIVALGMFAIPGAVSVPPAAAARPASAAGTPGAGPAAEAERIVEKMTVAEQAASIVMGHLPTTDAAALSAYMQGSGIGGFILMGENVPPSEGELRAVTTALGAGAVVPPLIAIDQEGGDVSRLEWDDLPASATLKDLPVAATAAAFAARAALVARTGANVNFGVVADTTPDPSSFIYRRALGADPASAAERVAAAVAAEEPLIASTLKHFPGHGAAPGDSHELIPRTDESLEQWRQSDALPFAAGIDAGASLLMIGHLSYEAVDPLPASLSARWHEIARDELGFEGVIVTDDLGMLLSTGLQEFADPVANAVAAVTAGADLVLMVAYTTPETAGQIASGIGAAVDAGTLPPERLRDAAVHVMTLRLDRAATGAAWWPAG